MVPRKKPAQTVEPSPAQTRLGPVETNLLSALDPDRADTISRTWQQCRDR